VGGGDGMQTGQGEVCTVLLGFKSKLGSRPQREERWCVFSAVEAEGGLVSRLVHSAEWRGGVQGGRAKASIHDQERLYRLDVLKQKSVQVVPTPGCAPSRHPLGHLLQEHGPPPPAPWLLSPHPALPVREH